jgi:hypothetical protein
MQDSEVREGQVLMANIVTVQGNYDGVWLDLIIPPPHERHEQAPSEPATETAQTKRAFLPWQEISHERANSSRIMDLFSRQNRFPVKVVNVNIRESQWGIDVSKQAVTRIERRECRRAYKRRADSKIERLPCGSPDGASSKAARERRCLSSSGRKLSRKVSQPAPAAHQHAPHLCTLPALLVPALRPSRLSHHALASCRSRQALGGSGSESPSPPVLQRTKSVRFQEAVRVTDGASCWEQELAAEASKPAGPTGKCQLACEIDLLGDGQLFLQGIDACSDEYDEYDEYDDDGGGGGGGGGGNGGGASGGGGRAGSTPRAPQGARAEGFKDSDSDEDDEDDEGEPLHGRALLAAECRAVVAGLMARVPGGGGGGGGGSECGGARAVERQRVPARDRDHCRDREHCNHLRAQIVTTGKYCLPDEGVGVAAAVLLEQIFECCGRGSGGGGGGGAASGKGSAGQQQEEGRWRAPATSALGAAALVKRFAPLLTAVVGESEEQQVCLLAALWPGATAAADDHDDEDGADGGWSDEGDDSEGDGDGDGRVAAPEKPALVPPALAPPTAAAEAAAIGSAVPSECLRHLYDQDVVDEDAVLRWWGEREPCNADGKALTAFVEWLQNASEEEEDDDDEE